MNKEENYDSDSDQSDEDFCPENIGNDSDAASGEEEESDDAASDDCSDEDTNGHEKQKRAAKNLKKSKENSIRIGIDKTTAVRSTRQSEFKQNGRTKAAAEKDELKSDEEADKSHSDALWADFLSDVGDNCKTDAKSAAKPKEISAKQATETAATIATKPEVTTEVLELTGERGSVQNPSSFSIKKNAQELPKQQRAASSKPFSAITGLCSLGTAKRTANGTGGGLGSLIHQLGKKKKLSVLEKSQLDWKTFKSDEGIDEELQTHNKGKDGYLERQDFLQRTDMRQFEIEKSLRQTRRQN